MTVEQMEMVTVKEAAEMLKVSKPTVRALMKDGKLSGFELGKNGMMRIPKSNLMQFIEDGLKANKDSNETANTEKEAHDG